jgi:putative ATP-binding cassette transporter
MKLFRFLFAGAGLTAIAGAVTGLLGGLVSAAALALLSPAIEHSGTTNGPLILFCVATALSVGLNVASEYLASWRAQELLLSMRLGLARQLLATPLPKLEAIGNPALLAALTEDATAISNALPGVAQLVPQVAIVVGCFAYMVWIAPWGAAVVSILMVLGLFFYALPGRFAVRAIQEGRTRGDALMGHFRALVEGVKQLQVHAGRTGEFLERRLGPTAQALRRSSIRAFSMFLLGTNVGRSFFLIAIFSIVALSPHFGATRTVTVALSMTVLYLTRPLEVILSWLPAIGQADVAVKRLGALGMALERFEPRRAASVTPAPRRLELRGCTYEHRAPSGDAFHLGPIDLDLRAGELMIVRGGNGSGKTTLAKLVVGLLRPDGGQIVVDGQPITDRDAYRSLFSVVFADSFPFEDFRIPGEIDAADAWLATHGLDGGSFKGLMSQPAQTLSQGQRKRALLFSALAEDRPVYVFDESAAEQDPLFKEVFYRAVLPALRERGKALLVISHDDAYFDVADQLLRLEHGRLVERRTAGRGGGHAAQEASTGA